jgi:hypothetical protein
MKDFLIYEEHEVIQTMMMRVFSKAECGGRKASFGRRP